MAIRDYQPDQEILFWLTPREMPPQDHFIPFLQEIRASPTSVIVSSITRSAGVYTLAPGHRSKKWK